MCFEHFFKVHYAFIRLRIGCNLALLKTLEVTVVYSLCISTVYAV